MPDEVDKISMQVTMRSSVSWVVQAIVAFREAVYSTILSIEPIPLVP